MSKKSIISLIIFPGSNCDRDLQVAVKKIIGINPDMVWHQESYIKKTNMILIPGGFSFGDYLRAGILATKSSAIKEVIRWSKKGIPIIGICNGFQILTECNLLPGALMKNSDPKFICKDINLKINRENLFSKLYDKKNTIKLPIAHSQGNYYIKKSQIKSLIDNQQIFFQYSDKKGVVDENSNPNGSLLNIAGLTNTGGNVIGMMPHPERAIKNKLTDGKEFFKGLNNLL